MRYYLVAGESSGDLHGANLMKSILKADPQAQFRFFGGDKMKNVGGELVSHYRERAFMGIWDVLKNIRKISKYIRLCKEDIVQWKPDAVVFIDNPGFNLRVAKYVKKAGYKTFYYIAPKVWAWNQKRVFKIKERVDHLFCILPFEIKFFKNYGIQATYVGNPLMDEISAFKTNDQFKENNGITQPLVALLPGSRKQEIEKILPSMLSVVNQFPTYDFAIACTSDFSEEYYRSFTTEMSNVKLVFSDTYNLLKHSEAALVTSGTATLETALLGIPEIVCYKTNDLTYTLGKRLIKVPYISLVNLILNKLAVPEFIQNDLNAVKLESKLKELLTRNSAARNKMLENYKELRALVGGSGASDQTAALICTMVK